MTDYNLKKGDKVQVRNFNEHMWKDAIFLRIIGGEFKYLVLINGVELAYRYISSPYGK